MEYEKILEHLKAHKLDSYRVMIATACDSAWENNQKSIEKAMKDHGGIKYDDFCNACETVWLDCEEDTGLTAIADKVAYYIIENGELPDSFLQVDGYEYDDELDDEEDDD